MTNNKLKPDVLLLGGQENALCIVRSLSEYGVRVFLSARKNCAAHYSRYLSGSYPIVGRSHEQNWTKLLLMEKKEIPDNSIILACSDEAIEFVATHDHELRKHYTLESNKPDVRLSLLRKDLSSDIARAAGIAVPNYKVIRNFSDLDDVIGKWMLPIIVKPVLKHRVPIEFESSLEHCSSYDAVRFLVERALQQNVAVILCEDIPGPDKYLRSYYTYMDASGEPMFHFTKRMIRRYPTRYGDGAYHITQWLPDVAAEGLKFFRHAGLRGLGNVEFKWDERDGRLKFIECNARFTAAQEQIARSGYDLGRFVYGQLSGRPISFAPRYQEGVRLWYPVRDFRAYRQLSRMGELSFLEWLRSVSHKQTFPFFSWRDPMPQFFRLYSKIIRRKDS